VTEIRDVTMISLPTSMRVVAAPVLCWLVVNDDGTVVEPIRSFVVELAASGTAPSSRRSYCHDLLRWWRFCATVGTSWDQAGTSEVRDFVRWMQNHPNPQRRRAGNPRSRPPAGSINAVTGKTYLRNGYALRTINHALSVVSAFYAFMYEAGLGPWNPVPGSHGDHRVPVRRARYRQKLPIIQPRAISEANLQDLFAALRNDRDRALMALALSSGARAAELLSVTVRGMDPARASSP
jgi:integrase/recombinase XerC